MEFRDIVTDRRSVKAYDTDHEITDETLRAIFAQVVLSPSSFNMQHWHFVVVREPARKAALRKCAMGQAQVEEASACIVVVGRLNAHERASKVFADAPAEVRDAMIPMVEGFYRDKPQLQRDEAIRSGSLAAMTLMYAAQDHGYATGPMIGFDPAAVSKAIGLGAHEFPIMLVVIGRQVGQMRPRAMRFPLSQVVTFNTLDGPGLT
jgi:nitroreductase